MTIKPKKNVRHFNIVNVVLTTQDQNEAENRRFVIFQMNNVRVNLQLDIISDIVIINEKTWKNGAPTLKKATTKISCGVLGKMFACRNCV